MQSNEQHLTIVSSELREGDVVLTHGMRVLLDSEPRTDPRGPYGPVTHCEGLVLNRDEVADAAVPFAWTAVKEFREGDGWTRTGAHRWVVQGNDNKQWRVVRQRPDVSGDPVYTCFTADQAVSEARTALAVCNLTQAETDDCLRTLEIVRAWRVARGAVA